MRTRILVVDDDFAICEWLHHLLESQGYEVCWRLHATEAIELLKEQDFEIVIADMDLGGESGMELCRRIRENRPGTQVIMITGYGNMTAAIEAIQCGASDFIVKPVDTEFLQQAIVRSLQPHHGQERSTRLAQTCVPTTASLGALLGTSPVMHPVYDLIRRVAASDTTVLLTGESGTGKELVARALHEYGKNTAGRFVAINCAAVPAELLESELFGHVRGAFTDAKSDRQGLFGQASHGTLLLDEIGEMPLEMQPKLLRVLQERQVRAVGGNATVPMTARIVAATNRNLEEDVSTKCFREDLFYRLNVVPIHIPPLRARGNDVLLLAEHFVLSFASRAGVRVRGIAPSAQRQLLDYDWPGNVRQLENAMERAIALTTSEYIEPEDLPEHIQRGSLGAGVAEDGVEPLFTWDQLERRQIQRALRQSSSNKTEAAKALGIDRRTLYRKLERHSRPARTQVAVNREVGTRSKS
jgi:DNA-binding NtrC family response regulator